MERDVVRRPGSGKNSGGQRKQTRGGKSRTGSRRGGGRGGGGGGGGFSKKGTSSSSFYDEDAVLAPMPVKEVSQEQASPSSVVDQRHKVELKRLHMSSSTRQLIRNTLQELNGKRFDASRTAVTRCRPGVLSSQYWMQDRQLIVEDACSHGADGSTPRQQLPDSAELEFRRFAVKQLCGYGFHESRCVSSLDAADGDLNAALDSLLSSAFSSTSIDDPPAVTDDLNSSSIAEDRCDYMQERADELSALRAIYDDDDLSPDSSSGPAVRIAESTQLLCRIVLQLPDLYAAITGTVASTSAVSTASSFSSGVVGARADRCRSFARGACRRGARCRFLHTAPRSTAQDDTPAHLRRSPDVDRFHLQVRFGDGCRYPLSAPLLCVSMGAGEAVGGAAACLQLSAHLNAEARQLALSQQPVLFQLVTILQDTPRLLRVISGNYHPYSLPADLVLPVTPAVKSLPPPAAAGPNRPSSAGPKRRQQLARPAAGTESRQLQPAEYRRLQQLRSQLPAWSKRQLIVDTVRKHQVVIVSGATGCGKSTQVPQFLLDSACQINADSVTSQRCRRCHGNGCADDVTTILCSQPRRISAVGVAERVSQERCEAIGSTVGYQIRLENRQSAATRILFCTEGILLRRLQSADALKEVTHVVLDEVHERSEDSDFLLSVLRDMLPTRSDLRLILMSATVDARLFSDYFGGAPVIEIPGRTFAVEQHFLESIVEMCDYRLEDSSPFSRRPVAGGGDGSSEELVRSAPGGPTAGPLPRATLPDERLALSQLALRYPDCAASTHRSLSLLDTEKLDWDLMETLMLWLANGQHQLPRQGSILVFLPGLAEITTLMERLQQHAAFSRSSSRFTLIPLHSSLTSEEQQLIFRKPKPGMRKVVVSTNLAETSITIDDCVIVIDAGKMKEIAFDAHRQMESLETVWLSRANADQRKGRAGRVQAGVCFHLYTSHRYRHTLRAQPVPEMQRKPLEQLVLRIKILPMLANKSLEQVFEGMLEPPSQQNIVAALHRLRQLGALDSDQSLTPLGHHVANLPVDVRIGKLLLLGSVFGCLDSVTTVAACLSYRSPFSAPFHKRAEADAMRLQFAMHNSDQLAQLRAYRGWREAVRCGSRAAGHAYARQHWLSARTLDTLAQLKRQYTDLLAAAGFAPSAADSTGSADRNSENWRLIAALLCAALYPNLARVLTPEVTYSRSEAGALARAPTAAQIKFKTKLDGYVFVHPSSVASKCSRFESPYLVFHEKMKTSRVFIRECSMVPVYPLLLFAGRGADVERHGEDQYVVSLDGGWIKLACPDQEVASMLTELRSEMDLLLAAKIEDPSLDLNLCPRGQRIVAAIVSLVTSEW